MTITLSQELVPATANRVPRALALRTQITGADSFTPARRRSITAMKRVTPTSPAPTPKASCRRGSGWSIRPPTTPSSRP